MNYEPIYDTLKKMHKILLAILLFAVFFFPNSEVFAQTACPTVYECRAGETPSTLATGALRCTPPGGTSLNLPQSGLTSCSSGTPDAKCQCVNPVPAPGAPAAGGGAAPCTGSACTNGGGQRCYIAPGSTDDGKPIPPGFGPPLTGKTGIYTAIGCIPTEPKEFVEGLLKYGTVAAGAIAFILMLLGALGLITAEGNPETIKASQERFYSALIGLLFIIFAVLLMQVIGVDVLGLPEFGR